MTTITQTLLAAAETAAHAKWAEEVAYGRKFLEGGDGYNPHTSEAERLSSVAVDMEYALERANK